MSSITTISNKFDYSQSKLPTPADGINYFGINWTKQQSVDFGREKEFTVNESTVYMIHIHGYVTRNILEAYDNKVVQCNIQNRNGLFNVIIPVDPFSNITHVDIILFATGKELTYNTLNFYDINGKQVNSKSYITLKSDLYSC